MFVFFFIQKNIFTVSVELLFLSIPLFLSLRRHIICFRLFSCTFEIRLCEFDETPNFFFRVHCFDCSNRCWYFSSAFSQFLAHYISILRICFSKNANSNRLSILYKKTCGILILNCNEINRKLLSFSHKKSAAVFVCFVQCGYGFACKQMIHNCKPHSLHRITLLQMLVFKHETKIKLHQNA